MTDRPNRKTIHLAAEHALRSKRTQQYDNNNKI